MDVTPYINTFATRSFRDPADQDYILARVACRYEFDIQFRWCALHAVEKYLKAILLYNGRSSKGIGHKVVEALGRVESISDLEFEVPDDVRKFIEYLGNYGGDRYLSHPTHIPMYAMPNLDKTVWYVRRFCFYVRGRFKSASGEMIERLPGSIRMIKDTMFERHPNRYRIFDGYLESIIRKKHPAYEALIWKNFFYGRVTKTRIRNSRLRMISSEPVHFRHPEVFEELDRLVQFPEPVREHFGRNHKNEGKL